ncbi:MAG TPA: hypothetical protein VFT06_08405 [Flavisolibacter sp.]|nr:hypothetical protein [Flavisolibacter sp.]
MKKMVLLICALGCIFSLTSSAQITKGSVLLGGGISGGKNKSENNNQESQYSSFSFYPAIGLAVKENTVVGLRLSYYHSKSESDNSPYKQEQNGYSAGFFYRKYMPFSKKFYLFGEGAAYYGHSDLKYIYPDSESIQETNNVGVNFYPGVAFAVNKSIHLEVGLNNLVDLSYNKSESKNTSSGNTTTTSKASGFGFSTNVSTSAPLTVGFRFVLGK